MENKYLKVIEVLGEVIINKDLDISVLKYENKRLEEKLSSIEQYIDCYENSASNTKI